LGEGDRLRKSERGGKFRFGEIRGALTKDSPKKKKKKKKKKINKQLKPLHPRSISFCSATSLSLYLYSSFPKKKKSKNPKKRLKNQSGV